MSRMGNREARASASGFQEQVSSFSGIVNCEHLDFFLYFLRKLPPLPFLLTAFSVLFLSSSLSHPPDR